MEGFPLRTVQALNVAKLVHDYDSANPDIGMGPSADTLIDRALELLKYDRQAVDMETVRKGLREYMRRGH